MKIYKDPTYTENLRRSRRMTEFNDADEDGRDKHRNRIMNAAMKRKRKKEKRLNGTTTQQ